MCMIGIIYCAYNKVNKKRYIGQTIKDLAIRIRGHYSNYSNCLYFHRALMKYKKEDWEWKVIDKDVFGEKLDIKERFWINFFHTTNKDYGYNIAEGGRGNTCLEHTDAQKRAIRKSMIEQSQTIYSENVNIYSRPIKNVKTKCVFFSISEAARASQIDSSYIRQELKKENGEWTTLDKDEEIKYYPNALYCVELNTIYLNVRQARLKDHFHPGGLGAAMKKGDPYEKKTYAGYSFYWLNPQYHTVE